MATVTVSGIWNVADTGTLSLTRAGDGVPEPSTLVLLEIGVTSIGFRLVKKRV